MGERRCLSARVHRRAVLSLPPETPTRMRSPGAIMRYFARARPTSRFRTRYVPLNLGKTQPNTGSVIFRVLDEGDLAGRDFPQRNHDVFVLG